MDGDLIYECGCGSESFNLYADGHVGCPKCDAYFSNLKVVFPAGIEVWDTTGARMH